MPGYRPSTRVHHRGISARAFRRCLHVTAALVSLRPVAAARRFAERRHGAGERYCRSQFKGEGCVKVNGEDAAGEAHARAARLLAPRLPLTARSVFRS